MQKLIFSLLASGLLSGGAMAQTSPNQQNPQPQDPQQQQESQQQQNPQQGQQQAQNPQQQAPSQRSGQQATTQSSTQPQTRPAPIRPGKVAPLRPTKVAPVKPRKVIPTRAPVGRNVTPVPSTRRDIEVPFSPHQNTLSRHGQEDMDGDGRDAVQNGGDDCDDGNPNRFPGNFEVPDFLGNDEDCDPSTIGDMDRDGDGFIDDRVWNAAFRYQGRELGGVYGDDCDDTKRGVNPGVPEIPYNGLDDNCDGDVDFDRSWPTRPPDR